ncbi:hypothetical protein H5410_005577 [Solanum commersonii]|uniref:Reverse transcriptase domain-containing protein n=1 Tax=Solanum commersonii TaxID=4109 RepID=A0A9J6A8N4_SOLCO|nr:hypothetical protein H5410_005577 [Solanum commersonii]
MSNNAIGFNSIIYSNCNIPSVIPQMEFGKGGVYTNLTSTLFDKFQSKSYGEKKLLEDMGSRAKHASIHSSASPGELESFLLLMLQRARIINLDETLLLHIIYADDTLVLYEAEGAQLRFLRLVFEGELSTTLGCNTGSLPTVYLGLPLGAKLKASVISQNILVKCEKRLANWKKESTYPWGFGGRWCLLIVEKRLDTIRSEFLLEGKQGGKRITPSELKNCHSIKMKELYGKWWLPKSIEGSTTTITTTYSL